MAKPKAVQSLVEDTEGFEHHVYSLNRLSALGGIRKLDETDRITCLTYGGPPYGILLETYLKPVAAWIGRDLQNRNMRVDVIHAHKLTIEGVIARHLAATLDRPYICSVRGNTDQKYLRLKPEKVRAFRKVARDAARLLPITPWIQAYVGTKLGIPMAGHAPLPTITECEGFIAPAQTQNRFVTAFHLDRWRPKGMPNLLTAMTQLKSGGTEVSLDVIGGGGEPAVRALTKEIEAHGLVNDVRLLGAVDHENMQQTLNGYSAFVMPTLRETFGMVYIEALFSGVPILYSRDRGIDGYFDDVDVGFRVDPTSSEHIAEGLLYLSQNEAQLKRSIGELQDNGQLDFFRREHICERYRNILMEIVDNA